MITWNQNTKKKHNFVTGRFLVYIKTEDIFEDIAKDLETRFDPSNYVT